MGGHGNDGRCPLRVLVSRYARDKTQAPVSLQRGGKAPLEYTAASPEKNQGEACKIEVEQLERPGIEPGARG